MYSQVLCYLFFVRHHTPFHRTFYLLQHDDPSVNGTDAWPRVKRPYASKVSKRLFVQVRRWQ
jgi:hypothetical protein